MTFRVEADEGPFEVRRNVAETLSIWPRVNGVPALVSSATRIVYDFAGRVLAASASVTPTTIVDATDGNRSRLDLAIPAISTYQEHARVDVAWVADGESDERLESHFFDVVREKWGGPLVAINDLLSVVPEVGGILTRQGTRLGVSAQTMAAEHARRAHGELYDALRTTVTAERSERIDDAGRYTRPRLLLDRQALKRVEVLVALANVFEADLQRADEGESDLGARYTHWRGRADAALRSLGPLAYDVDEDGVVDTIKPPLRSRRLRRVQG